jgi:hypothetical protein
MAVVGRAKFDHPALAATGGSGLHASVETLWTNTSNDLDARWVTYSAIANGATNTYEHNFGVAFDELTVLLYTGTHPNLTKVEDPTAAGWTIIATVGFEKTKIDITAPGSGGPHTFAVQVVHGRNAKFLDDLDDVDLTTTAPVAGNALVNDGTDWVPGYSDDPSFKVFSVTDPNAVILGGYLLLDDGRELATYDGAGSASTDFGGNLTVSLDTIFGGNPANATAYYLYINLSSLAAAVTQTDTGRKVYAVVEANFSLSTTTPEAIALNQYVPIAVIKSATSGTVWSGSGAAFANLARYMGQPSAGSTATDSVEGFVTSYAPIVASRVHAIGDANYTIGDDDGKDEYTVAPTGTSRTVTLPAAANNIGKCLTITNICDPGVISATAIARGGSDVIYDGVSKTSTSTPIGRSMNSKTLIAIASGVWAVKGAAGETVSFDLSTDANKGDFTAGTLVFERMGNIVVFRASGITHGSSSLPATASGFLSANFRPQVELTLNSAVNTASQVGCSVVITTNGTLKLAHYNDALQAASRTGINVNFADSYTIT